VWLEPSQALALPALRPLRRTSSWTICLRGKIAQIIEGLSYSGCRFFSLQAANLERPYEAGVDLLAEALLACAGVTT
jgi:hypothetical protein